MLTLPQAEKNLMPHAPGRGFFTRGLFSRMKTMSLEHAARLTVIRHKVLCFVAGQLPLSLSRILLSLICQAVRGPEERVIILRNLKAALGTSLNDRELFRTMLRNIDTLVQNEVDQLIFLNAGKRKLSRYLNRAVSINTPDTLEKYLRRGRGVILLSSHLGAFYLIPVLLALHGFKVTDLSSLPPQSNRRLENKVNEFDEQTGDARLTIKRVGNMAIRSLLRALRKNEIALLHADFHWGEGNGAVKIRFLNRTILAGYGAAWLHHKTRSPLVPAFVAEKNGRYEILIESPAEPTDEFDYQQTTQMILSVFEQRIMAEPQNWRMWKHFHRVLCEE